MEKDTTYLFEKEKISKAMITLARPSILVSIVDLIYSTVNAYFVGRLNNSAMLASMDPSSSIMMFIESVGACVGIGGASCLGRYLGAKKTDKVEETVRTSMTLCFLLSIIHMVLGFLIVKPFIMWQTDDPEVIRYATQYGTVSIFTMVFMVLRSTTVHVLRAVGDVKYSTTVISGSVLLNIILDPFFMFDWGLNLGVVGAALATAICNFVTCVLCFLRLQSSRTAISWRLFDFHIDKGISREILRVGVSCYVRNCLPAVTSAFYSKQVFRFGTEFVAGCSVGRHASHLLTYFIQGAVNGYLPLASYHYGARNYRRLYDTMIWCLSVLTLYSIAAAALIWLFNKPYVGLFASDPVVIEYGCQYLKAYTLALPVYAAYYVFTVSLQAAGKGKESMILSMARQGFIYLPIILILPNLFNQTGVYLAQPLSDYLTVAAALLLCWPLLSEIYHGSKNVKTTR